MLKSLKNFKIGQKLKIKINHRDGIKEYPELIYCEFKSYSNDLAGDPKELIVDQIIDIDKLVLKDASYRKVERILQLPQEYIGIFYF